MFEIVLRSSPARQKDGHGSGHMALLPLAGSTHVHHLRRASEGRDRRGRVNGTFALDNTFDGVTDTTPEGVIYIVSGGGGAKLYSVDLKKPLSISQRNTPATTSR